MYSYVWLLPGLPLLGSLLLIVFGPRLHRRIVATIGAGSIAAATVVAGLVTWTFLAHPPAGGGGAVRLWTWMEVEGLRPGIAFYLDALSVLMTLVITFVSTLIHFYS